MSDISILCVDDDPFYREFYANIFRTRDYDVRSAKDLQEGFDSATTNPPSLLILDIMMPETKGILDGYGLLRELRKNDATKEVPVIMISALDQSGDTDKALELGATKYIPKQELTPDRLLKEADDFLNE